MAIVDSPIRESYTPLDEELLIREARRRARRRRWIIGLIVVVTIAMALAVAGGKGRPPSARVANPRSSSRSGAVNGHHGAAPVVLGGQDVQSLWPEGGETSWVFTQNVTVPYNGGQGVEWTSDGGRTWRNATPAGYDISGGRYSLSSFFALSPRRAWVVAGWTTIGNLPHPRLLTTSNGGRSWSVSGTVPAIPCALSFSSANEGSCASQNGAGGAAPLQLFVTVNGGATWSKTFDNTAGFTVGDSADRGLPYMCDKQLSFTPGGVIWAKFVCNASAAVLYRTTNDGRTWTPVTLAQLSPALPGGAEFTGPVVLSGQRGAIAFREGNAGFVYVTRDGGRTFAPVYPPGPHRPWTVDVVTPTLWRLAYGNRIIGTNDGGASWTGLTLSPHSASTPRNVENLDIANLQFSSARFGWMTWPTGNGYRVMSTRDGGRTWRPATIPGTGPRRG